MMFAVKPFYLCNCCGKAWGPKATLKDFRALVWGHERESEGEGEASTGYEKGTDTGNGHIWHRFIVSGTSHSKLIMSTAQSSAWHSHIHFQVWHLTKLLLQLSGGSGNFIIPRLGRRRLELRGQKLCCLLPLTLMLSHRSWCD